MRVALIGDSIRLHAEPFVRDCLPQRFQLQSPAVNCRSSHDVVAGIRAWVPPGTVDIVHVNCGLHDVRHDPGRDRPVSSLREYADNLRNTFAYLAGIGASVIWATSTPVSEGGHAGGYRWFLADLVEYNQLSSALAREFAFQVNDLYGRLSTMPVEALLLPDGVHFNDAGNQLIGQYVADAIQACGA